MTGRPDGYLPVPILTKLEQLDLLFRSTFCDNRQILSKSSKNDSNCPRAPLSTLFSTN
jgi:hypothetical protein